MWCLQISTMSMVVAAIVEVVRLGEVRRMNLFTSTAPVPMSVFWLVPQYFIIGAAEIMVNIGTLEMFYSEVRLSCMSRESTCLGMCVLPDTRVCLDTKICMHVLGDALVVHQIRLQFSGLVLAQSLRGCLLLQSCGIACMPR